MPPSGDWLICPRVHMLLAQLDPVLRDAASGATPEIVAVANHLISRGGKRLRPALLLLAAGFGRSEKERLLRAAAALELIHVASLYHDDIMDRALTRRGGTTANSEWGNEVAAAGGTYLFARASALLASLGESVNRLASEAAVRLCTGQLHEVENAYNPDLTEEEHLDILAAKTATLFELPCRLGADLGAAVRPHADALADYARSIGLAFQLADDALDLAGDAGRLGKATLTDVREGIYSFPVLRALRHDGADGARLRALLRQARMTEVELQEAIQIVRSSGAVEEGLAAARDFAERARQPLRRLPEGAGRESLDGLAAFAASRAN